MSSLLRSTKFVRYFTGAARTLILNSAKTAETSSLVNLKAVSAANNVVMRDYATTKKTESLEPLLQKLDSEVRRYGRITKKDIDEVFDEIKTKNDISSSQSLLVIRCCGELVPEELPEQRTLLVQKIWGVLTERGVPMDISHYNALLRVYLENEHHFSPAQFLEELEKKGLQPNRVTYQRLMWRYCQEGDVEGATKVLERMRELNLPVSEPVLNALVMGHAFHGDTDGAKAVLETMAAAGLQPTNRTYTLLACGYAKKGDIENVEATIKTATDKDAYMTDKDILDIIEHLAVGGHSDKVEQIFSHLHKGVGYNQDVCNLIFRLLNQGQEETAKKIMKTMPKSTNADDTLFKGAFFVKQLLKLNKPSDSIIKTCKELKEEGLIPYALYIATEGALQSGRVELAQKLFKELQNDGFEIRQHYYWPLLAHKGKEGDEEGLMQLIRSMIAAGVPLSGEGLRDYVLPYMMGKDTEENIILKLQIASVSVVHAARNLMAELLDAGKITKAKNIAVRYRPRGQYTLLNRPLINALNKTKDIDSFVTILHIISSSPQVAQSEEDSANDDTVDTDDTVVINEVGRTIRSAVKNLVKPDLCEQLLTAVHAKGLRISNYAAEEIEQFLGQNMTTKLSQLLSLLTSPDLEPVPLDTTRRTELPGTSAQLEELLAQMKNKGITNTNRVQKQLLSVYIKENNIEKVNNYLQELKSSGFELNALTMAQLYEFYCENDDIEKANEVKALLIEKDPNFVLNKFKLIHMAYALVRAKKYDEALQFLTDNKPRKDEDIKTFGYNSKCWQMLNTVAEDQNDIKVKELTKVLIENNYIEPSNVILGPSIKVHLQKQDIAGALEEFEHCCKEYRSTPWKGELMKALIMSEDATRLQWLADLSTQIHGEVNILHDLVLAFVECGRLRQARRILETPGLHTKQRRLDDACHRYVNEGKSEYLEGLLEATKELSHIDRSNIFYHLLMSYCKAGESDKALGLWTILQEEGEVPSNQFLITLGKHLKANKRPVPFIMPEDKKLDSHLSSSKKSERTNALARPLDLPIKSSPMSDTIENLVKDGKASHAADLALKSIGTGSRPRTTVLKFLLKTLAMEGNVEKIVMLGKSSKFTEEMKRILSYDDKLTLALFNSGAGGQHVESLLQEVNAADTEDKLQIALRKFPRSQALELCMQNPEVLAKCQKVAEIAASKGFKIPVNLIWMEYILLGKEKEADKLWNLYLKDSTSVVFRRLLQESHTRNQPQHIEKLIAALKSNDKMTPGTIGNPYSRLINVYLLDNKIDKAMSTLDDAIKSGIQTTNLNISCLKKLKSAVEAEGKEFNYDI